MDTVGTSEGRIDLMILIKHTLQLVDPLRAALAPFSSGLLAAFRRLLDDPR